MSIAGVVVRLQFLPFDEHSGFYTTWLGNSQLPLVVFKRKLTKQQFNVLQTSEIPGCRHQQLPAGGVKVQIANQKMLPEINTTLLPSRFLPLLVFTAV